MTIARTSPKDVMQRQMIVELNGEVIATLMYGETVTRALEPGRHRLRIDNTWVWKNVEFSAAPGDHIKFRAINRAGRLTWWMVAALGAGPMYITLEREP